jgi:hypothetical protein
MTSPATKTWSPLGFVFLRISSLLNRLPLPGYSPPNPNLLGELKEYRIGFEGFATLHADMFGLVSTETSPNIKTAWKLNPGSHDTTIAAAPGAVSLAIIGLCWLRKRRRSQCC